MPLALAEAPDLEAFLASRRGGPVRLLVPRRGEKRELMELAARNATETLAREHARWLADHGKTLAALEELAAALGLAGPPMRIECYDISTLQGRETVGSMVVFEEGRPRTGEYRRFRVRSVTGAPDDFASHQEVLRRRFRGAKAGEEGSEEERRWAMPDLVVIDGGRGQVSAALEVLDELGLADLPLVGLAKEREELFLPGRSDPILLAVDLAGALPRPAAARRGPSLRHHLPPRSARQARRPLGVRRPARRRPEAAGGPAAGVRLAQAGPRGARRAGGGGARHRAGHGRPDQGGARGLRSGATAAAVGESVYHPAPMRRATPFIILFVGLLALAIDFWPGLTLPFGGTDGGQRVVETKLGLDLEGGLRVEYQALPVNGKSPTASDMSVIRDIIDRRVNSTGVAEPIVITQGVDRVVVELPGVEDPEAIRQLVGQTGKLEFVPIPPDSALAGQVQSGQTLDLVAYPPLFGGDQITSAIAGHRSARSDRRQLHPRRRGRLAVRHLHHGQRRQPVRDRPRRHGHLGAGHPEPDHRRLRARSPGAAAASPRPRPTT